MKIGIFVYSQTGNTSSVAKTLQEKLAASGHEVKAEAILPAGKLHPGKKEVEFQSKPDPAEYDGLILAAPVQAFSLSEGMKAYVSQLEASALEGKEIGCFVTKQLPGKWTGGNRALRQIRSLCKEKGGTIASSSIIIWSSKKRDAMIHDTMATLGALF
jgi:flavodoxin